MALIHTILTVHKDPVRLIYPALAQHNAPMVAEDEREGYTRLTYPALAQHNAPMVAEDEREG